MAKRNLAEPIEALFVRFAPKEWNNLPCMRVEVYGEPTSKSSDVANKMQFKSF